MRSCHMIFHVASGQLSSIWFTDFIRLLKLMAMALVLHVSSRSPDYYSDDRSAQLCKLIAFAVCGRVRPPEQCQL
eukprot:871024-Amphidinium_carterae.1